MTIRTRILLGFLVIYLTSFYFLFDTLFREIRPRYLETVEDSLNDTVNILAAMMEMEAENGKISHSRLDGIFTHAFKRRFKGLSKIF